MRIGDLLLFQLKEWGFKAWFYMDKPYDITFQYGDGISARYYTIFIIDGKIELGKWNALISDHYYNIYDEHLIDKLKQDINGYIENINVNV